LQKSKKKTKRKPETDLQHDQTKKQKKSRQDIHRSLCGQVTDKDIFALKADVAFDWTRKRLFPFNLSSSILFHGFFFFDSSQINDAMSFVRRWCLTLLLLI
jgi:hypothetical protein